MCLRWLIRGFPFQSNVDEAAAISACLTIMLAYRRANAPKQTTPLGRFEYWSLTVRDALPDPCANAGRLCDADPDRERFVYVAAQWEQHFKTDWKKVAEVINEANQPSIPNSELKLAIMNVADAGRDISESPRRVSKPVRKPTSRRL
jgi:hypothetical protein